MKKNIFILSIVILFIILITIIIYFIFFYKPPFVTNIDKINMANENENQTIEQENDTFEDEGNLTVNEYIDEKQNNISLIFASKKIKINNMSVLYSIENILSGESTGIDFDKKSLVYGHKIATNGNDISVVYHYDFYDLDNKNLRFNYILIFSYNALKVSDKAINKILLKTRYKLEIIDLFWDNDRFTIFYTITKRSKLHQLVGEKTLYMQNFRIINNDIIINNPKIVHLPLHQMLFELRVIKEDNAYTLIYRARISNERKKIDIIVSKMNREAKITKSTNIPINLPEGVVNNIEVLKADSDNYALVFSYTNLDTNSSSIMILFFDEEASLKKVPYLELDPAKAKSDVPKGIKLIYLNELYFIFFKYKNIGYYLTSVDKDGNRIFLPVLIKKSSYKDEVLSVTTYDDKLITVMFNEIRAYKINVEKGELKLDYDKYEFEAKELISSLQMDPQICVYNKDFGLVWIKDKLKTYTGVIKSKNIFDNMD